MRLPLVISRLLIVLQLLTLMPRLASVSVCVRADGCQQLELTACECLRFDIPSGPASLASAHDDDCGPCRDESLSALRVTPAHANPLAPLALAVLPVPAATPDVAVMPARVVSPHAASATRSPLLRC